MNNVKYQGIGAHVYDLKTLRCHFDRLKAHFTVPLVSINIDDLILFSFPSFFVCCLFTVFQVIFCIFLPGIVIGSLHMRIYISTSTHSDLRRKQFASQYHYTLSAVRVARSLFITFIVFFICWYMIWFFSLIKNWKTKISLKNVLL
jgi:hypothetical protein